MGQLVPRRFLLEAQSSQVIAESEFLSVTRRLIVLIRIFTLLLLTAYAVAADDSLALYREGSRLDAPAARGVEERVSKKPKDWKNRVRLLGFWTLGEEADLDRARAERSSTLLWLIENRPEADILGYPFTAVIIPDGHELADASSYSAARLLWSDLVSDPKASPSVAFNAATFFATLDPELAHDLAARLDQNDRDVSNLSGRICAAAYIGALGADHSSPFVMRVDAELSGSAVAQACRKAARDSSSVDFLAAFVVKTARDGSDFYSVGGLDWDYSPLLQEALDRARHLAPEHCCLRLVPGVDLPDTRIPALPLVGTSKREALNVLLEQPPPQYPESQHSLGIAGDASVMVVLNPNGSVKEMRPAEGSKPFVEAAMAAISRWKYHPIEHRGQKHFVPTRVEVHFRLH